MSKNRLSHIDGFRGILAISIAIYHHNRSLMFPGAYLGVDFFFVLSGFILSYVYLPRMERITAYDFIGARLARLWPLHVFTIFLYTVIYIPSNYFASGEFKLTPDWRGNDFTSLFENVFLIQNIGLQEKLTWNYPAWSISVELWVNIVLFFILGTLAFKEKNAKTLTVLAFIVLASYTLLEVSLSHLGGKPAILTQYAYIFNAGLIRGFAGIFLGVLVFKAVAAIDGRMERSFPPFLTGLKVVTEFLLFAGIFYIICFQEKSETDITAVFMFALLLGISTVGQTSFLRNILSAKPLTFLGMISYGVYLCHAPLLQFFKRWSEFFGEDWNEWLVAGIFISTVIFVAALTHYFIEKPGQKAFMNVWRRVRKSTIGST